MLVLDALLAAPALAALRGQTIVVKVGGSIQDDPAQMRLVMRDVSLLAAAGAGVVVVHGGGKAISAAMKAAGLTPRFVKGQRYTDAATLAIAERVLARGVNAEIVAMLREAGCAAVPLHSLGCCVLGATRIADDDGEDLGFVGRVKPAAASEAEEGSAVAELVSRASQTASGSGGANARVSASVNVAVLKGLLLQSLTPVVAPVAIDLSASETDPGKLNVNADLAAGAVAGHMRAERFILVSDTPGVRVGADATSFVRSLSVANIAELRASGVIDGGMIPKLQGCIDALAAGAKSVWIVDGRVPLATLAAAQDHAHTPGTRIGDENGDAGSPAMRGGVQRP